MTRYNLLNEMRAKQAIIQTENSEKRISYNKLIQSGDLRHEHYDYGVGFYDVSMSYFMHIRDGFEVHICRVWFGTIDDGDFGSWNEFEFKEEAVDLLKKVVKRFEKIDRLPTSKELNEEFRNIGVYFCLE